MNVLMNGKQSKKQKDLLNITDNTECSVKVDSEDVTIKELPNNPLFIIREKGDFFVSLGNYRVSEVFDNEDQAIKDAKRTDLERIVQLIEVVQLINKEQ